MDDTVDDKIFEIKVAVHGRVQGVGFRARVLPLAKQYHLKGTIQNLNNGTVEICAQGKQADLLAFLEAVKSTFADNVDYLSASYLPSLSSFQEFIIL